METQKLTHTHIYMVMCWKQRNENYVYLNDFYLPFNMKEIEGKTSNFNVSKIFLFFSSLLSCVLFECICIVPLAPQIIPEDCSAENNSVTVAWHAPNHSFVQGYVLELDDGSGGEFRVSTTFLNDL